MANTNVTVTVENLAAENGAFLTPAWVGFHNGNFDTYDRGRPASLGLESLAEDGVTAGISQEFLASGSGIVDGTLTGAEGVADVIDPGEVVSQTFTLDSEDPNNYFLNYASMLIPSNDAFVANGDGASVPIFDESGNFIGADFIIYGDEVLDAGTEVNDEAADSTAFFGQAAPNTGETEAGVVQSHPGFDVEGRILSEDGSDENAAAAFTGADFTVPGAEIARISIRNDEQLPPPPDLVDVTVTVENLSPANGTPLTPLWAGFHDGDFDTYDRGRPATSGLESLAEDGATEGISEEFLASGAGFIDAAITGDEGATPGIIDVGETTSFTFTVDRSLASSRYFNYASMVLPSNDAFVANGDPLDHEIFDESGNFVAEDFSILGDEILDAGTEVNDEAADSTAFFSQAEPNTGETEAGVVESHPGFNSEGRILNAEDFVNADFTQPDYDVAKISFAIDEEANTSSSEMMSEGNEVYRFFSEQKQLEFYTTSEFERDFIVENLPVYQLEGVAFIGAPEPISGEDTETSPVRRFLNTSTGVHLYTVDETEISAVAENSNYVDEGIAYYGYDNQVEGTEAVYRFYNSDLDAHFYTSSLSERDTYLDSPDFQPEGEDEGIAFYAQPAV